MQQDQIWESCVALDVGEPASSRVLCREIVMDQPAVTLRDADDDFFELCFAHVFIDLHLRYSL